MTARLRGARPLGRTESNLEMLRSVLEGADWVLLRATVQT